MSKLFSDFSSVSKEDWLKKVEQDLKGKPLENLNFTIDDDLNFSPFAHKDDFENQQNAITKNQADNDWQIGEEIFVQSLITANKNALHALENGVEALRFILNDCPNLSELSSLLKGINLQIISTHFQFNNNFGNQFFSDFSKYCLENQFDSANLNGSIGFEKMEEFQKLGTEILKTISEKFPKFDFVINSRNSDKNTDSVSSNLAGILANCNEVFSAFSEKNINLSRIVVRIEIGENYFLNIAKIRALKMLWSQFTDGWKTNAELKIETHLSPTTQSDNANYNMIKSTTQAMSAVIGGINYLYILPSNAFDIKEGNSFSRRISRNIQHLLKMESYLHRVNDPAAGSYFIEQLTNSLAEKAWQRFQEKA